MSVVELACVVGLVIPALYKPLAVLAPIAAVVIAAEMLLFCALHLLSGDSESRPDGLLACRGRHMRVHRLWQACAEAALETIRTSPGGVTSKADSPRRKRTAATEGKAFGGCEAGPPFGRQSADRQGLWRRSGAGLYRGHARLEERCRQTARRDHRDGGARCEEGGEMEFAALRRRRQFVVPRHPRLREIRQGRLLPRRAVFIRFRRSLPSRRTCAISTSTRTTNSTRSSSPPG